MVDAVPDGRTLVVVVDDAHRWVESRARFEPALQESLKKANALGRSIHVTLVAPELPGTRLGEECLLPPLHLAPLSFRGASHFLPGATTRDKLKAYTVFGGLPGVLTLLDSRATLASNFRRIVLAREAPLREAPLTLLERYFQRPNRYAAILRSLASGEGDWSTVQTGVGDLTASGQAGPYLKRLEEVGLVESRRSLDASPRTRSRRYRLTDPFIAYWFRFVLPLRESLVMPLREAVGSTPRDSAGRGGRKGPQAKGLPPGFDSQLASVLPEVCRRYMAFDAMEVLGANAREWGSLWGPGYEIPVAGVLRNGTPFYGHVVPSEAPLSTSALTALDAQVRETRFGYGRERRLRILFGGGRVSPALLRQMARRDDAVLVDLDTLGP
jgi:hypothetical protein